jgi:hypothetical protein
MKAERPAISASCDVVSFSARQLKGIPEEDLQKIQQVVDRCIYKRNLEAITADGNQFHVTYTPKSITLKNFAFRRSLKPEQHVGVCHELTYYVKAELEEVLRDKYYFIVLNGLSEKYFNAESSGHFFLIALPVEPVVESLANDAMLTENPGQLKRIPDGVLVIDPSFGIVDLAQNTPGHKVRHYLGTLTQKDFEELEFFPLQGGKLSTPAVPLGFAADIFREHCPDSIPSDSLISIFFLKNELLSRPQLNFTYSKHDSPGVGWAMNGIAGPDWKEVVEQLPQDDPLRKFVKQVQKMRLFF